MYQEYPATVENFGACAGKQKEEKLSNTRTSPTELEKTSKYETEKVCCQTC
jgi:hypothetical protein